jgi:molecular chaperone GrpE
MTGERAHHDTGGRGEGPSAGAPDPGASGPDDAVVEASATDEGDDVDAGSVDASVNASAVAASTVDGSDEVAEATRQAGEYLDHLRRLQAEFDNYRKRVVKEQARAIEMASEPLVRALLDVVDDFDLAMKSAEAAPEFEPFHKGVELVYAKLGDALRGAGVERIAAEGEPFDPQQHEALMQTGDGDGEPIVAEVFRNGYRLRGQVIRPAGVRVYRV